MSSRLAGRVGVLAAAVLLVACYALHVSWLVLRWGSDAQAPLLSNLLYTGCSVAAALTALGTAFRQRGRSRGGWLLVGLALAADAAGNATWSYLELVPKIFPFPSVADLLYLLFAPTVAAGLLRLLPASRTRRDALRLGLDLAVTVGAVGLFFWRFLFAPVLAQGGDPLPLLVGLAYPCSDLVLVSLLLLLVLRQGRGEPFRPELLLLGTGLGVKVLADFIYFAQQMSATYSTGVFLDGMWTGASTLVALAACSSFRYPRRARPRPEAYALNHRFVAAVPYLAVAAALGLLLVSEGRTTDHGSLGSKGVLYGSVVVTLLVVLRQLFALNENWRLTRHLEQHSAELERLSAGLERRVQTRTAELEALSRRFRHDALHDALTGLPNRTHFRERLEGAVAGGEAVAVLYLDFDHFKSVNDSFGHAVGDALLVALGGRLQAFVRPGDLAARLGGDEFAVLLAGVADAGAAAQTAGRLMKLFAEPFAVGGHLLPCTPSVGVVQGVGSAEDVMRDADIAMYRAKAQGRSRFVVFEAAMREGLQASLSLQAELRGAAARGELEVYYQPVVEAASGAVAGFEALVRWRHPRRGLVPPAEFIPLAEETGLVIDLDRWVLEVACAQLRTWSALAPTLTLNVNLSSRQFARPDLAPFVAGVLARSGVEPGRLKLELTETMLVGHTPAVQKNLAALRAVGVRLYIDDFGTGYSSLAYLQRFDADALKIDRSFVARMLTHEGSAELVRTMVGMTHSLGMEVVAEGVESPAQLARLRALGCRYVQGFLFSRPVPAAEAERLLCPADVTAV